MEKKRSRKRSRKRSKTRLSRKNFKGGAQDVNQPHTYYIRRISPTEYYLHKTVSFESFSIQHETSDDAITSYISFNPVTLSLIINPTNIILKIGGNEYLIEYIENKVSEENMKLYIQKMTINNPATSSDFTPDQNIRLLKIFIERILIYIRNYPNVNTSILNSFNQRFFENLRLPNLPKPIHIVQGNILPIIV
jgi:hypothetical protein